LDVEKLIVQVHIIGEVRVFVHHRIHFLDVTYKLLERFLEKGDDVGIFVVDEVCEILVNSGELIDIEPVAFSFEKS
jgi:hypothetical protein